MDPAELLRGTLQLLGSFTSLSRDRWVGVYGTELCSEMLLD